MKTLITETNPHRSRADITILILGLAGVLLMLWVALSNQWSWPGYTEMITSPARTIGC